MDREARGAVRHADAARAQLVAARHQAAARADGAWACAFRNPEFFLCSISASPTACPLRGFGLAGTQNDRLGPYPGNGHAVGDAEMPIIVMAM